jgi:hypothetical protein
MGRRVWRFYVFLFARKMELSRNVLLPGNSYSTLRVEGVERFFPPPPNRFASLGITDIQTSGLSVHQN